MGIILKPSGEKKGYKDTVELAHEKEVERKKYKSMWIGDDIGPQGTIFAKSVKG